ncbi:MULTISPECIES: MarR family winged helix-turn-helix transcriptional regulator [unclassified Gordonia (in: high G+C Gram-positive bacteria)]|uniref:MarR family winged helix-turn-helix transcriptional regulator n=1 Tax=Gordonia TaxID=2053 RepID=UPI00071CB166|nr:MULTISPECIES: MarR family transcriptional regulator [unclassified Gordonia (in: high G+C Gram-positive bacteria)]KSU58558.1 MarR family transcriptional regulator [Gordonia sp. SGD-V-85]MBR7195109.1 MarR family transcriptional regulator [Gordonia sp. SCSIO 19800]MCX2755584.1 MarR family transcriptional regulator [Gordonia sp. 4N]SCC23088.1 DNA-binding transcriptional regulator, MarR family [Gordonia sp. v-85]
MHAPYGDGSLSGDLSLAVVRLARRLRGRRENKLVSLTQLSALNTLHHEGPMTPGALAAAERVRPPSMTRVIASLSDLGMIKREPHPTDGRQAIVTLSPEGVEVVTDELAARTAWLSDRLAELSAEERDILREAVRIANKILGQADTDVPRSRAI